MTKFVKFLPVISFVTLCSCSNQQAYKILALCEKDGKGDYSLRWEVYPEEDNIPVEIYASANDTVFPSQPLMTSVSNNYIAVIPKADSLGYRFFRLKVGDTMSDIIANRIYEMDSIQNFRDIGGYSTTDRKVVKWGKVFRSGSLAYCSMADKAELDKLEIKSIIDLRPVKMSARRPSAYTTPPNLYKLPITNYINDSASKMIIEGKFLKGDAVIYSQDLYRDMVENYSDYYAQMFDKLCDENNYPVIINCTLGKDQTGIASYLLLRALGVPADVAEEDYMLSNVGINKLRILNGADKLSESRQEALTMLTRTDKAYLRYAIACIRTKYGTIEDYMADELRLTPSKKAKLRKILLYNEPK